MGHSMLSSKSVMFFIEVVKFNGLSRHFKSAQHHKNKEAVGTYNVFPYNDKQIQQLNYCRPSEKSKFFSEQIKKIVFELMHLTLYSSLVLLLLFDN
jgi:hypothetical protein